jgi:hypothetical protein
MNEFARVLTERLNESTHSDNFEIFARLHPDVFKELKEKIKNKIVISIGGGGSDNILKIAQESGARIFINVDSKDYKRESTDFAKFAVANAEDFLACLSPSSSYCFEVSGIDESSYKGDFYTLASQLQSMMKNGSIIFGVNSEPVAELFTPKDYKTLFTDGRFFIFEKR